MNPTSLHNSATRGRGRRLAVASAISALALVGAVGLGFTYSGAQAQLKNADSVQTPFGRAPLSFADIVDRVKPAVVSIQVSNGAKVAANQKGTPRRGPEGMPADGVSLHRGDGLRRGRRLPGRPPHQATP